MAGPNPADCRSSVVGTAFLGALRKAREALSKQEFARGLQLLRGVALTPQAARNEEYENLRKQSLDGMKSLHVDRQRKPTGGF